MAIDPEQLEAINSTADLYALIELIQSRIQEINLEREQEEVDLSTQVMDAIGTLEALRGPDNPEPPSMERLLAGEVSITEVRTFSPSELQDHSGLALTLSLAGLQVLTETVTAIARVQSGLID